ncbi:MAG: hypothetical protein CL678_07035 [Bdellovibrionaceae bacterium]|nr:hypothetical protein [Pseudobdellovibrionaceae bacterium]|tara:strand:- start:350 stop:1156 length:807 start_codon:yes stop_codon:yes gene_type:complete
MKSKIYSFLNEEAEEFKKASLRFGEAIYYTRKCPGSQKENGDSLVIIDMDETTVLLLADGAGGTPGGNKASKEILEIMSSEITSAKNTEEVTTKVLNGFQKANDHLLSQKTGAASTLSVVEIQSESIRPYHAGDSPILIVGQKGKRKLLTTVHSVTGFAVEAGLLAEDEALSHEENHLLLNFVGNAQMRVEVGSPQSFDPLDRLFICSDGVSDNLAYEEIEELVRKGDLISCAKELVKILEKRMEDSKSKFHKPDDYSFILFSPEKSN